MNKFRILGVIAIIAIIANFFGGLDENWRDFKKGFEDGHNSAMEIYEPGRHIIPHHATSVKLFLLIDPVAHFHLTPRSIYICQCTAPPLVCIHQCKLGNPHSC